MKTDKYFGFSCFVLMFSIVFEPSIYIFYPVSFFQSFQKRKNTVLVHLTFNNSILNPPLSKIRENNGFAIRSTKVNHPHAHPCRINISDVMLKNYTKMLNFYTTPPPSSRFNANHFQ